MNNTDNQCLFNPLYDKDKNVLNNNSFDNLYYPWCYYKPDSYMLYSNNRTKDCGLPCDKSDCHNENLGIFNKDGSMNINIPRKNSITNKNFNWCFNKKDKKNFKSPNIEICNIPFTEKGTYPDCSDCVIKAGGGGSCTDILMTANNNNLNKIGFKHYPLIQIGKNFNKHFLKVPAESNPKNNAKIYTWPDNSGKFKIYYNDFKCNYYNHKCSDCSCILDTLKTTFIIPQNSSLQSNGKIPYIIIYGFEQNNAYNWGWGTYSQYPIFTADLLEDGTSIYSDYSTTNPKTYFETIKQIVYSGIAVIGLANNFGNKRNGQWTDKLYDYGPYLPGKPPDLSKIDSTLYWNNGNNFVNNYIKEVMDYIYDDSELDYNRCAVMGYSLGAQMVSRFYQEFPSMYTKKNIPFPNISCGIMIAGGTLHCFENDNPNTCPPNKTEPIYDNGDISWDKHPATLLFQNRPDSYSDKNATENYFNTLAKNGVPCYLINKYLILNSKHAIAVCKNKWDKNSNNENDLTLTTTILFLLKYL